MGGSRTHTPLPRAGSTARPQPRGRAGVRTAPRPGLSSRCRASRRSRPSSEKSSTAISATSTTEAGFPGKYRAMNATEPVRNASVLLGFRAENTRSFRDEFELSMLSTRLADEDAVRYVTWREDGRPIGILPVASVFGANASGKTNVVKAMDDMRAHVLHSFRAGSPTGGILRRPYLLDPASKHVPSRYEVDIVLADVRHEYGFVIDDDRVIDEWAFHYPHGRAALLFRRQDTHV